MRRVPLSQIKPELLEKDGKLAEAFCAGVWSGLGMSSLYIYLFHLKKNSVYIWLAGRVRRGLTSNFFFCLFPPPTGFAYQRRFLEKKYRNDPATADHLWDTRDLKASTYEVGTKITDHFEVVSKTPESIIVRCGDSPRVQDVRESDGLFEMSAVIRKDEGVAVLGLKSLFYNGLAQPDQTGTPGSGPMGTWIQWLHQQYDKVLMETALKNITQ